jgi:hypothetical protein
MAASRKPSRWDQRPSIPANDNNSSKYQQQSPIQQLAAMASQGDKLSRSEWPLFLSLLTRRAAFISDQILSIPPIVLPHPSNSSTSAPSSHSQKSSRHAEEHNKAGSSDRDGFQRVVTTADKRRMRYEQNVEKRKQQFPDRPIHKRTDHNPSACEPGCFYHDDDLTKHRHDEMHDRYGQLCRRGILRNPRAAKPRPESPSSSRNSDDNKHHSNSSVPDAPPLDPEWQSVRVEESVATIIAIHVSRADIATQPTQAKSISILGRAIPKPPSSPPPAPPSNLGKRPPSTPSTPQEPPKKHVGQPAASADSNWVPSSFTPLPCPPQLLTPPLQLTPPSSTLSPSHAE